MVLNDTSSQAKLTVSIPLANDEECHVYEIVKGTPLEWSYGSDYDYRAILVDSSRGWGTGSRAMDTKSKPKEHMM